MFQLMRLRNLSVIPSGTNMAEMSVGVGQEVGLRITWLRYVLVWDRKLDCYGHGLDECWCGTGSWAAMDMAWMSVGVGQEVGLLWTWLR